MDHLHELLAFQSALDRCQWSVLVQMTSSYDSLTWHGSYPASIHHLQKYAVHTMDLELAESVQSAPPRAELAYQPIQLSRPEQTMGQEC